MQTITINQFHNNLHTHIEKVLADHKPLKVGYSHNESFIVIRASDWEQEQETLYVLQNNSLMTQIARSITTHLQGTGRQITPEDLNEIDSI